MGIKKINNNKITDLPHKNVHYMHVHAKLYKYTRYMLSYSFICYIYNYMYICTLFINL